MQGKQAKIVSPTQERAILGYLATTRYPARDHVMFLLSMKAGLRAKEMASLAWAMCGLSHIMADFRQIMWRKFLRSLCKHDTMEQQVLPHNVAWPFSAFLPSWCRHLSDAKICGRKKILTLNLASILRKMVLPDNVALSVFSHIFLRTDTQSCRKHVFGRSRHIMWQKWQVRAG